MSLLRFLKILLILTTIFFLIGLNLSLIFYYHYSKDLPRIYTIKDYKPLTTTNIYDREGRLLYRLYNQKRTQIDIDKIPKNVINAFLAAEDAEFFSHRGIDLTTILRALYVNLISGKVKQGGSTITQQVVKTFFLSPERTLSRKIKEAILSFRLEKNLTKNEILHLYLNQIYFGAGNYGIYEAARYFFNKSPEQLSVTEAAFLAALVKAPEPFATFKDPQRVRDRVLHIIRQMEKNGFITSSEARHYAEEPLNFSFNQKEYEMSYSVSFALKRIKEVMDINILYNGGYNIYLTIDKDIDSTIQKQLTEYLNEINADKFSPIATLNEQEFYNVELYTRNLISDFKRHHQKISEVFRSVDYTQNKRMGLLITKPYSDEISIREYIERHTRVSPLEEGRIYLGIVTGIEKDNIQIFSGESVLEIKYPKVHRENNKENKLKKGDVIFYVVLSNGSLKIANPPLIQGAVVLLDNKSGDILGLSGGYSYVINEFNRAYQAERQPGSAFKPILYSYAIESGIYNIVSIENDAPIEYRDPQTGNIYRPSNYDKDEFKGEMTLIDAITESKNTVSVRVLLNLGLEKVSTFVNNLGLNIDVKPYPSLALGAFEISLLSITQFFSALGNEGIMNRAEILSSIKDENGNEVFTNKQEPKQILLPETAYIITRMLKDVVKRGTGTAANVEGLHIAGKTGTTNNYTNAWFIGYTPQVTCGIMIGRDDNRSMGRKATGGNLAAPLFKKILKSPNVFKLLDNSDFNPPISIKFIRVNIHTGRRCEDDSDECIFLPFREGFEPPQESTDTEKDIMRIEH
ncbi:MAG: penicillin-binding protein 1A [Myxococcota bacterium]